MAQLSLFKGKRQRGVRPPPPKEYDTHCMVADTLRRWGTTGWRWTHFPAGEYRHPATAARLRRMGVQVGWADFQLLCPYPPMIHFLELKRKGQKPSDFQQAFGDYCITNGYVWRWADNYEDAINILKGWGAVRASVSV